jgi:hypothetical protein
MKIVTGYLLGIMYFSACVGACVAIEPNPEKGSWLHTAGVVVRAAAWPVWVPGMAVYKIVR